MLGEGTRVDSVDAGDFFFVKPLGQGAVGLPVGVVKGIVLSHYGTGVYVAALVVFADVVFLATRRDAVVAEYGIGGHKYLTLIGRVGKTFGIAGHGGVENDLAGCRSIVAERLPFKSGAVRKNQTGALNLSHAVLGMSY